MFPEHRYRIKRSLQFTETVTQTKNPEHEVKELVKPFEILQHILKTFSYTDNEISPCLDLDSNLAQPKASSTQGSIENKRRAAIWYISREKSLARWYLVRYP